VTVYARGYRRYEKGLEARRFRFLPITRQGTAQATSGAAFWVLFCLVLAVLLIFSVVLYVETSAGELLQRSFSFSPERLNEAQIAERNLRTTLVRFFQVSDWLAILLVLFTSAGIVADDLKARALPLYLVRPITPLDYYLGKLLVPVRVLARAVLWPGLLLILFAALMRPTDEALSFPWAQSAAIEAVLARFAVVGLAYGSVVLLFSAATSRRITAAILGTVTFMGGGLLRGAVNPLHGDVVEGVRALSIAADADVVFYRVLGYTPSLLDGHGRLPQLGPALVVLSFMVLLAAWIVLRRARTVEVVA
jgi:hypothetical protein